MPSSINQLICELLANPTGFKERGMAYQLLQEYFTGLSLETLRPLFHHNDILVQHAAVWVASELGEQACTLLEDIVPLVESNDRFLVYHALEIITVCATGKRVCHFIAVPKSLESQDDIIKVLAMRLLMRADSSQLEYAAKSADQIGKNQTQHRKGLLLLAGRESSNPDEVQRMLYEDNTTAKMYGAISAKLMRHKYPELLQVAVELTGEHIRRFVEEPEIGGHNTY